jgi:histidinol-phosphate aminotransferase
MPKQSETAVRKAIAEAQSLGVYDIGETVEGLAQKLGKKPEQILKLNSNENFFVPLDFLRGILRESVDEVDPRIYPRDEYAEFKKALGRYYKVSSDQIVVGTGSDDLIGLVSKMMLRKGDEALAISPTFSIYERCTRIQGATYKPVPLKENFSLDTERLLDAVSDKTKVIFLCSPNNPTANSLARRDIEYLAENFGGVVAVDEAYADFSGGSIVEAVNNYENLVVFRTFSKVFGLAGLRLGCAVSNPVLARVLDERFQMPYTVTLATLRASSKILQRMDVIGKAVDEVKAQRGALIKSLNRIAGVKAFRSETNFVLFQTSKDSGTVCKKLLGKGVIVRDIGQVLGYENCLRVTVAPEPMMGGFLDALKEVLR